MTVPMEHSDHPPLRLQPLLTEMSALNDSIEAFAEAHSLDGIDTHALVLAIEEIFTNTVKYGEQEAGAEPIEVSFAIEDGRLIVVYSDAGIEFDPTGDKAPTVPHYATPTEERPVGKLGIHFVKTMMESFLYQRRNGRNVIRLTRRLGTGKLKHSP
jgi:anti-sigma regulatory factor (Ser/Thr protein kinase)